MRRKRNWVIQKLGVNICNYVSLISALSFMSDTTVKHYFRQGTSVPDTDEFAWEAWAAQLFGQWKEIKQKKKENEA